MALVPFHPLQQPRLLNHRLDLSLRLRRGVAVTPLTVLAHLSVLSLDVLNKLALRFERQNSSCQSLDVTMDRGRSHQAPCLAKVPVANRQHPHLLEAAEKALRQLQSVSVLLQQL